MSAVKCPRCTDEIADAIGRSGSDAFRCRTCCHVFDRDEPRHKRRCTGEYDDGIADGNPTNCSTREGCELFGCPARVAQP